MNNKNLSNSQSAWMTYKKYIANFVNNNNKVIDVVSLIIGFLSIGLNLAIDEGSCEIFKKLGDVLSILCFTVSLLYFGATFRLLYQKIEFDRLLVRGNYLLKIVTLVVLMPSFIAVSLWFIRPGDVQVNIADNSNIERVEVLASPSDSAISTMPRYHIYQKVFFHFMGKGDATKANDGIGRMCVAIFAILGTLFLNGLFISTIIGWVDGRKNRWNNGVITYKVRHFGKRRYAVIIGANEMASLVIRRLLGGNADNSDNKYVILQTSRNPEDVREELMSHLSVKQMQRVVIYQGLRDSMSEIERLHLEWCNEVYILGESIKSDGSDSSHDAMNMRCANLIAMYLSKNSWNNRDGEYPKLKCRIMFEYQTTYQMLQFSDVSQNVKNRLDFIPFNRYESWARKVMVVGEACNYITDGDGESNNIRYLPLDGDGIKLNDDKHVHFVIVGMTKMGIAMGVQALLQAHYMNYAHSENNGDRDGINARRTRITFIDPMAKQHMNFFKGRYDNLFSLVRHRYIDANNCEKDELYPVSTAGWEDPVANPEFKYSHICSNGNNLLDIEIEFIEGSLEMDRIRDYLTYISNSNCDYKLASKNGVQDVGADNISKERNCQWVDTSEFTLAICHSDMSESAAGALYMPIDVYEKANQIWVYQRESADIILNLMYANNTDCRYNKLRPFGMIYGGYVDDDDNTTEAILVNAVYNLVNLNNLDKREKRDMMLKFKTDWDDLMMVNKFSNYYFVDSIPQKIRAVGSIESIKDVKYLNALARMEHNRWVAQELILGFSPCSEDVTKELEAAVVALTPKLRALDNIKTTFSEAEYKARKSEIMSDWKIIRNRHRDGISHMHPCICAFEFIDNVDVEAKRYDATLNSAIPDILRLADELSNLH